MKCRYDTREKCTEQCKNINTCAWMKDKTRREKVQQGKKRGDTMNKQILKEYIDACELIKETEAELEKLRVKKDTIAMDKVSGSMSEFPYAKTSFKIEGAVETGRNDNAIRQQEQILVERKANAEQIKQQVELWINTIPVRMQRIIKYHFFEGLGWEKTAKKIGRRATGDSIKKEFQRFLEKK